MTLDLKTARLSDTFGVWPQWRKDAGLAWHAADDIPAPLRTPILAPDPGEVVYTGPGWALGDLGYYTISDHGDYGLLMAHQDAPYPDLVRRFDAGDVIGRTGNTGWSTGPHVHVIMSATRYRNGRHNFERDAGGCVSPRLYFDTGGYRDEAVFLDLFNREVTAGKVWAVVTRRVVTKAELLLLSRVGVETVSIHVGGQWRLMALDAPAFTHATFPAVLDKDTVLMVKRAPSARVEGKAA